MSRLVFTMCVFMPAVAFAAEEHHGPSLSGLIWRIVVFAVFFGIMFLLLKDRIPKMLGDKAAGIVNAMGEAKNACDESEKELAEYSRKLAEMNAELEKMKETALKTAEKEAELTVKDAEGSAVKVNELAERSINMEFEKARSDLFKEMAFLAVTEAENTLSKDGDTTKKQQYIKNNISNVRVSA